MGRPVRAFLPLQRNCLIGADGQGPAAIFQRLSALGAGLPGQDQPALAAAAGHGYGFTVHADGNFALGRGHVALDPFQAAQAGLHLIAGIAGLRGVHAQQIPSG